MCIAHVKRKVVGVLSSVVHHFFFVYQRGYDVQFAAVVLRVFKSAVAARRTVSTYNYSYSDCDSYNTKNLPGFFH